MMKLRYLLYVVVCMFMFNTMYGQNKAAGQIKSIEEGSIAEKFDYVRRESNNYKYYELVKQDMFKKLEVIVGDTLDELHKSIAALNGQTEQAQDSLQAYRAKLDKLNVSLEKAKNAGASIQFFGSEMDKGVFKTVFWVIALGLLAVIVYLIYRGRDNQYLVEKTRENYKNLQEEYDGYKKRALEREQKLKRELMDERNKGM